VIGVAGGSASSANDPVLYSGTRGGNANSLWNLITDPNGRYQQN